MNKEIFYRNDVKLVVNHLRSILKPVDILSNINIKEVVQNRRDVIEKYGSINGITPQISKDINVIKTKVRGIPCEWVYNKYSNLNKRILFLHGGAFLGGSLNSHRPLCAELSKRANACVLSVDYSLAPENPFPSGLEDCYDAYEWLLNHNPNGREKTESIFIVGDSAGGNLSISLLFLIRKNCIQMPNAVLPISPPLDLLGKSPSSYNLNNFDPALNREMYTKALPLVYLFGKDLLKIDKSKLNKITLITKFIKDNKKLIKNPLVSPIYGNLKGFPPILINVGDIEILRDDSIRFVDKARNFGVNAHVKVWSNMIHVFVAFLGYIPEADQCINEMVDFINHYS